MLNVKSLFHFLLPLSLVEAFCAFSAAIYLRHDSRKKCMIIYLEKWQTLTMAEPELRCAVKHRRTWHVQQPGLKLTGAAAGKKNVVMTSSVVALCWCIWMVWVLDCLTQKEHIFWVIIAYFQILGGSSALVGPAVNCFLWQMGPGDSANQSCIFSQHRVYWMEQKSLSVEHR